ncbi:protein O-mannosyltransferase 1 [Lucilia cuprina]|uniref:protein O-mannosyltransferase 1 n=1 Tax=Lucilia cuprina TaxID=7375 RepID=UPI001F06FBCC|nr:protein O-mannosyltransferase 1 [Lucilia cuprina]
MSTNSNNILQRRKPSKNKSKHVNDKDLLLNSAAESSIITTTTAQSDKNERLQSGRESNKLEKERKNFNTANNNNCTATAASTAAVAAATTTFTTTIHNLCNGNITPIVNCCRDINCCLNATSNTASTNALATCQPLLRDSAGSLSKESSLRRSISSSRNSYKSNSTEAQNPTIKSDKQDSLSTLQPDKFVLQIHLDLFAWTLFILGFLTRFYKLSYPRNVVFDELHYGKFISHYIRNIFFFDQHPPLGKQIIGSVAQFIGFNGNFSVTRIGSEYDANIPIFWLRFVPALCGSLLPSTVYHLLLETGLTKWCSLLGGLLIVFDNALLTQSRFVLMESMLLLFCSIGLYFLLKFQKSQFPQISWLLYGVAASCLLTCAMCVKYVGFLTFCLAGYLILRYFWNLIYDATKSTFHLILQSAVQFGIFTIIPICIYLGIFYIHLNTLYRAGPHDSVMTSAFQASLEGGLASITKGQPIQVAHGSQITLRHTYGRTCWLHSHAHVYPVRYPDKRGSSHQQQVTCYSFKDVNNWWIVKRPERDDLVVGDEPDAIRHGDVIQLVHGITSRALNSHDVAAPMTPQCQEVSCYIDYEINMEGEILWRVDILNKDTQGPIWHAIKSEVRLIHVSTGAAMRYTGRQLPDWGFNQHEVAADRVIDNKDAIWNVEEHRYTKAHDEKEREKQLLAAEMLPTKPTALTFFDKFFELQSKMLWHGPQIQAHMYSSGPLEWPLLSKGIAYWLDTTSNGQIHLLGNILIWYTSTLGVLVYMILGVFYLLRRRRLCYDIDESEWQKFLSVGHIFFAGYLIHYLPYFFMERTLFLHHYFPAFLFKLQLLCYVIEHIDYLLRRYCGSALWMVRSYRLAVISWFVAVISVYIRFLPLSYGLEKLTAEEVIKLRWKDTWDFVIQRDISVH